MQVDLDIFELGYLLDTCLRGSHLRSSTVTRFVDEFYYKLDEAERMKLFEWSVRLTYAWSGHKCFEPQDTCCGQDRIFMLRYHPLNQYKVITEFNGKTEQHRAFKMNGSYFINSRQRIAEEYIISTEQIDLSKLWEPYTVVGIDYDKNILDCTDMIEQENKEIKENE